MKVSTKREMKIRKLYDEGHSIQVIAGNLNLTFNQVEKTIIKTAQAKKETQPLTLESFINNCEKIGCTVIRY